MANLLQEPFKDWVTKQIQVRQKSLGKYNNITEQDLKFYSTSTPFLRLASSVDLTETEMAELSYITDIQKNELDVLSSTTSKEETFKTYYERRAAIAPTLTGRETIQKANFTFPIKNSVLDKLLESNPKLTKDEIFGSGLAKRFILQGGVIRNFKGEQGDLNAGLNDGNSVFNGAYGWGGINERGYVPMPGITSAQVQYQNNGALSTTTIKIKAFSREQFSLIDALYMRPGYNLLLEFGHSVYLDNENKLQSWNNFITEPLSRFLKGNIDQYELLKVINVEKEKYFGNYEAIFGKITKFKWNLNKDGSYDIEIKITGNGDVIESLKINLQQGETIIGSEVVAPVEGETETEEQQDPPLVADREKSSLNRFLYRLSNFTDANAKKVDFNKGNTQLDETYATPTYQFYNAIGGSGGVNQPLPPFDNFPRLGDDGKYIRKSEINSRIYVLQQFGIITDGGEKETTQTFIQFIHLLAFIESDLMLYDGDTPLTRFDFNYYEPHKDENYMLTFPGQFSSDPRVCIIPITNNNVDGLEPIMMRPSPEFTPPSYIEDEINIKSHFTTNEESGVPSENNTYLGRLGGIYINANYIAETLANTEKDEKGDISILDFLNSLLSGVGIALGGINQFRVTFDELTGTIRFYEDAPQRFNNPKTLPEYAKLNVYGVSPNEGSFVTNINLDSELSNKFATQVSVGAQAGGNELSSNASSFSSYNRGLVDRIIKNKNNKPNPTSGNGSSPKETLTNNWGGAPQTDGKIRTSFIKTYVRGMNNSFDLGMALSLNDVGFKDPRLFYTSEYIDMLNEFNKQFSNIVVGSLQQNGQIADFFLPFNLKINIKGMSGMVLYQQFSINTKILPASYNETGVNYIIKALNHSITPQSWETEIETTPVGLPKTNKINSSNVTPIANTGGDNSQPIVKSIQPPENPGDKFVIYDSVMDGGTKQYDSFNSEITKEVLISRMHPSARPKFTQFFTELENNYKGYTARINSIGRKLLVTQNFRLKGIPPTNQPNPNKAQPYAGGSNHNYFMALDMNIILPNGTILTKDKTPKNKWLETGIIDIAKKYGIDWGGNYANYVDQVHFSVPFNIDKAKEQLSILFPDFKPNEKNDEAVLTKIDNFTKNGGGIYKINIT